MASLINPISSRPKHDPVAVDPALLPAGWIVATERPLVMGESVLCAEGFATLSRILGKTGDGSRLLELILPGRPRHPYFAAASNTMIAPAG